jgi:FSR family fosmidomycin resistance protein-like MFS transporter
MSSSTPAPEDARPGRRLSAGSLALAYGLVHALVDASCVIAVWRTGGSLQVRFFSGFAIVLGYDLIAFATQWPFGLVVDRLGLRRVVAHAGIGLSILALLLAHYSAIATMIAAGLGNSLYHLGAGAAVLRASGARAAPAGLFVAPGALGLGLGTWMGKTGIGPAWPLVALLALAVSLIEVLPEIDAPERREDAWRPEPKPSGWPWAAALALVFLSVTIRSFVGFGACRGCPQGAALLVGIPLVAFGGKLLGGLIADRLGWIETSVAALLLSTLLIAWHGENVAVALAGLLLFQMTMPVTLVAVAGLMPRRPAAAFGLPCLALIAGALPTFFPAGRQLFSAPLFLGLIPASALAVLVALRAMGFRVGMRPPFGFCGAGEPGPASPSSPEADYAGGNVATGRSP